MDLLPSEADVEGVGGVAAAGQFDTELRGWHRGQLPGSLAEVGVFRSSDLPWKERNRSTSRAVLGPPPAPSPCPAPRPAPWPSLCSRDTSRPFMPQPPGNPVAPPPCGWVAGPPILPSASRGRLPDLAPLSPHVPQFVYVLRPSLLDASPGSTLPLLSGARPRR